ncbi:unnamed protein product [Pedinophyceae sp. YPF-701]|nr:unnamed protein product [Pedinophyceae sp. YPF-701]
MSSARQSQNTGICDDEMPLEQSIEELQQGGQADNDDDSGDEETDEVVGSPLASISQHASSVFTATLTDRLQARQYASHLPRQKGHLCFGSNFEGGNVGAVRPVGQHEWEIWLRPDTEAPRHRLWFWFEVQNCKADQRAIFSIVNFSKQRSLYRDCMTPLVRSTSRPRWERISSRNVFYYRSPAHRNAYILSFVFLFDNEDDHYEFAYSFPYTPSRLQRHLGLLEALHPPHFRRELLCRTLQGRRCDILTVADPWAEQEQLAMSLPRKVVFLTARVHPGETPASFCMEGIINFLASTDPNAAALRRLVTFIIVPMLNPDGCYLGNYRCDATGVDLNRMWDTASASLEPTLHATRALLQRLQDSPEYEVAIFMDIHAHSTARVNMCYCNGDQSAAGTERHMRLLRIFDSCMLGFSQSACVFEGSSSKIGCARRQAALICPDAVACTLEVSFYINKPPLSDAGILQSQHQQLQRLQPHELALQQGDDTVQSGEVDFIEHADMSPSTTQSPVQAAALLGSVDLNTEERYIEMGSQVALGIADFFNIPRQRTVSQRSLELLRGATTIAQSSRQALTALGLRNNNGEGTGVWTAAAEGASIFPAGSQPPVSVGHDRREDAARTYEPRSGTTGRSSKLIAAHGKSVEPSGTIAEEQVAAGGPAAVSVNCKSGPNDADGQRAPAEDCRDAVLHPLESLAQFSVDTGRKGPDKDTAAAALQGIKGSAIRQPCTTMADSGAALSEACQDVVPLEKGRCDACDLPVDQASVDCCGQPARNRDGHRGRSPLDALHSGHAAISADGAEDHAGSPGALRRVNGLTEAAKGHSDDVSDDRSLPAIHLARGYQPRQPFAGAPGPARPRKEEHNDRPPRDANVARSGSKRNNLPVRDRSSMSASRMTDVERAKRDMNGVVLPNVVGQANDLPDLFDHARSLAGPDKLRDHPSGPSDVRAADRPFRTQSVGQMVQSAIGIHGLEAQDLGVAGEAAVSLRDASMPGPTFAAHLSAERTSSSNLIASLSRRIGNRRFAGRHRSYRTTERGSLPAPAANGAAERQDSGSGSAQSGAAVPQERSGDARSRGEERHATGTDTYTVHRALQPLHEKLMATKRQAARYTQALAERSGMRERRKPDK